MGNFYQDVICVDPRFNSVQRITDLALLEPVTQQAVRDIIAAATQMGLPLIVFETYRSQDRQQALFTQGASKLRTVGVHHYGLACDLVRVIGGEPTWKVDYTFLGPLAVQAGLIWGGDWGSPGTKHTFVDSDHVQRVTVAEQKALFSGEWYPEDVLRA